MAPWINRLCNLTAGGRKKMGTLHKGALTPYIHRMADWSIFYSFISRRRKCLKKVRDTCWLCVKPATARGAKSKERRLSFIRTCFLFKIKVLDTIKSHFLEINALKTKWIMIITKRLYFIRVRLIFFWLNLGCRWKLLHVQLNCSSKAVDLPVWRRGKKNKNTPKNCTCRCTELLSESSL